MQSVSQTRKNEKRKMKNEKRKYVHSFFVRIGSNISRILSI
jgi:hypothetical protein